jgi:hypothetical protein
MQVERTDTEWKLEEGGESEKSLELLEAKGSSSLVSGRRVSNTWVTYPEVGNNCPKGQLIPHVVRHSFGGRKAQVALGGARGRLASWQGKGLPRL